MIIKGARVRNTRIADAVSGTVTFSYTGSDQTFVVPRYVTSITVTVNGASGGSASNNTDTALGGTGAGITTTIPVTSGDTLRIVVGAQGNPGISQSTSNTSCFYGGGGAGGAAGGSLGSSSGGAGGGYSGIFKENTISAATALVIAAGGGGAAVWRTYILSGGAGGTPAPGGTTTNEYGSFGPVSGFGATALNNGAAGVPFDPQLAPPTGGAALQGGAGGSTNNPPWSGGGGGGAGYYSGGGGAAGGLAFGAGGGGSSYVADGTDTTYTTNRGNGRVTITYNSDLNAIKTFTFNYTGTDQTFVVPEDITGLAVSVAGASGGSGSNYFGLVLGGTGAVVNTTVPVTPGDTLKIVVGAQGNAGVNLGTTRSTCAYGGGGSGGVGGTVGYNSTGGAGGGLSGIFTGNTVSVATALVVAGGGGGGSGWSQAADFRNSTASLGGAAGTSGAALSGGGTVIYGAVGGRGASTTANGAAGVPFDPNTVNPTAGTQLQGGAGGNLVGSDVSGGGGGGAGYYSGGGGAAGASATGGGGGGTSYVAAGPEPAYSTNRGNGLVVIRYVSPP